MLIKATIDNLKSFNASNILVIKDNKIVNFIMKDLTNDYSPYCVIGSDETYDAEQLFKLEFIVENCFLADADTFPIEFKINVINQDNNADNN